MSEPLPDDPAWSILETLLACLCQWLHRDPAEHPPPCRCFVAHGAEVAWDECCCRSGPQGPCCGQAWVRATSVNPEPGALLLSCHPDTMLLGIELGVLRCGPVVGDDGAPPPPEAVTAAARTALRDAKAMRDAVLCCYGGDARNVRFGGWAPLGPQERCHGGTMSVVVAYSRTEGLT